MGLSLTKRILLAIWGLAAVVILWVAFGVVSSCGTELSVCTISPWLYPVTGILMLGIEAFFFVPFFKRPIHAPQVYLVVPLIILALPLILGIETVMFFGANMITYYVGLTEIVYVAMFGLLSVWVWRKGNIDALSGCHALAWIMLNATALCAEYYLLTYY